MIFWQIRYLFCDNSKLPGTNFIGTGLAL